MADSSDSLKTETMCVRRVGTYVVFVHNEQAPSDDEWDLALEFYRRAKDADALRTLVFTAGAAPSAAQRARLNVALGSRKLPMAVLTSSALARAAGTAISWFNPRFRVFAPEDVEKAFDHLSASAADRELLRRALSEMRGELGIAA